MTDAASPAPLPRMPSPDRPRLAVRALLLHDDRLLVVNAYAAGSDLWCAPGGGVHPGTSLPDNLIREVQEETGLTVAVGPPALVNEFHDPATGFHQVEVFFRCTLVAGDPHGPWTDPEGVVARRAWVTRDALADLRHKPGALAAAAWGTGLLYDTLELIVR